MDCYDCLREIIKSEVKPSAGCTEIAAIGYAISLAKQGTEEPYSVELYLDYGVFKNAFAAGVPGGSFGIKEAVKRGLMSEPKGLETLSTAKGSYNKNFELLVKPIKTQGLFVYAKVNKRAAILAGAHDRVVYNGIAFNSVDEAIKAAGSTNENSQLENIYSKETMTVKLHYSEMLKYVDELAKDDSISKLIGDAIELDMKLANENLRSKKFFGLAKGMAENDVVQKATKYAAAAVEARMSGSSIPAMSVAGSGNQGITSTLPLYIYADSLGASKEELYRSITVSWLTTVYATAFTGYVSPLCSVGIKGGAGLATGFSYLMRGDERAAEISAINQISSLAGVVCDGAKPGCSLKVAPGVETAYRSAVLAVKGLRPPKLDGILGESLEETLMNVSEYLNSVSDYANVSISNILSAKLINKN